MGSLHEPVPGWVQGFNGASGILAGIGIGFIHSLYCVKNLRIDNVPVDFVANATIAVGWHTGTKR